MHIERIWAGVRRRWRQAGIHAEQTKGPGPDAGWSLTDQRLWDRVVEELAHIGITFTDGLTDDEAGALEKCYRFRFPPDLLMFLQTAVPVGDDFPPWKRRDADISGMFEHRDEMLWYIVQGVWPSEWGPQPSAPGETGRQLDRLLADAPRLIPVFLHRALPDEPNEAGNPVLSVHGTDIIHYGLDIVDYLRTEFGVAQWWTAPLAPKPIRFWDPEVLQRAHWGA